ncbi:MAG TPA: response regulator [Bacteroidota bacterium]|jgi:AmiR/NasT family two-component response regulator|nr:response regulator [Bacteroidota bacterium]
MLNSGEETTKARILIVEDEILIAKDLQKKLEQLGYTVPALASTAKDAVEKAGQVQPDIVLMDVVLKSKEDGIDAAEKIGSLYGLPVIYLTAYSDQKTLKRAKVTEPFGYILKPFDINLVSITIEMALYKHRIEKEKARLTAELQKSLAHIKRLTGLLPICAWCKKIRNDAGYWQDVESYFREHSDVDFSHGICPDCVEKYHKEFMQNRS